MVSSLSFAELGTAQPQLVSVLVAVTLVFGSRLSSILSILKLFFRVFHSNSH